MFDAPPKKPLPEIPIINNEREFCSSEIPKPIKFVHMTMTKTESFH